jgi:hypothetical protein
MTTAIARERHAKTGGATIPTQSGGSVTGWLAAASNAPQLAPRRCTVPVREHDLGGGATPRTHTDQF